MGLFPEAPKRSNPDGPQSFQEEVSSKFPPGSDERKAADRLIEILKQAHVIFRGIMKDDHAMRIRGEKELRKMIRDMGVTNIIDEMALASIIASFAAFTPPEVYGEDHNEW